MKQKEDYKKSGLKYFPTHILCKSYKDSAEKPHS